MHYLAICPTAEDPCSFWRIGAAIAAAAVGVPTHVVKMLGQWNSHASMLYTRTPRETLAAVSHSIAQ